MVLSFSTFNCRALQDSFKRKIMFSYLHKKTDDIIFLQETHSSAADEKFWASRWGCHSWLSSSEGLLFLLSLIIKFLSIPLTKTLLVDLLF